MEAEQSELRHIDSETGEIFQRLERCARVEDQNDPDFEQLYYYRNIRVREE